MCMYVYIYIYIYIPHDALCPGSLRHGAEPQLRAGPSPKSKDGDRETMMTTLVLCM